MTAPTNLSILVTGANGGLGLQTCKHLVRDGARQLTLACRTEEKAAGARQALRTALPEAQTQLVPAAGFDMTDPDAIRAAVAGLDPTVRFDVVFLQAGGVTFGKQWRTVEHAGHRVERTVFQNTIGAHVTLAALIERGLVAEGARVVIAGGEGARGIPGLIAKPEFASPQELRCFVTVADESRPYHDMNTMGVSKLAGAMWAQEAQARWGDHVEVIWFSPGLTAGTRGLAGVGRFKRFMLERIGFPLMVLLGKAQSPRRGARKYADCLEGRVGHGGDLIGAPEKTALGKLVDQKPMNPALTDPALRRELWGIVEEVCGPAPPWPAPRRAVAG